MNPPTSGSNGRCLEWSNDHLAAATTLLSLDQRNTAAKVHGKVARVSNVPQANPLPGSMRPQQRQAVADTMPLCLAPPDPVMNGVVFRIRPLPADTDATATVAVVASALMGIAAAISEYWRETLKASAICLLNTDESIMCRISPAEDGDICMKPTDASIKLQNNEPLTYLAMATPNRQSAERFCRAAVHAAFYRETPMAHDTSDGDREIIARHEAALSASMKSWLPSNDSAAIRERLLAHTGQPAT